MSVCVAGACQFLVSSRAAGRTGAIAIEIKRMAARPARTLPPDHCVGCGNNCRGRPQAAEL
ncbi:MAG: hypothetical protein OXU20_04865 [Myxococcales bacterium]|nr:hypothetical protein [Myxococcales bacterium]